MGSKPIRMSNITSRKNNTSGNSAPWVTFSMCNYARDMMNVPVVTEFAKNVSESFTDTNKYWENVLEFTEKLDSKENKAHPNLHRILEYEILPKLDKENLTAARKRLSESTDNYLDKDLCISIVEDNIVMDRILTNHRSLSKRYNFDKIAKETVRSKQIAEGVNSMCDLIDTYDISLQAKFNIALENISYAMSSSGYNKSVVEEVTDYFLSRTPVIPDFIYETMQNLIKDSRILTDSDKESVKYFTEAKGDIYRNNMVVLANRCLDKEAAKLIMSSLEIKNEKQAAAYIKKAMIMAETSTDADFIYDSIVSIPLMGKVSKAFVRYQYKINKDKMKVDKKLSKLDNKRIEEILDDDDESLIAESSLLTKYSEDNTVTEVATDMPDMINTALLESEDFAESEDIKKVLNDFKADQKKSIGKFKYCMAKIYKKSPESIIDDTPNILGTIRAVFIIAPTLAVPIIGPVISLVLLFVDKILSMKINEKQCNDLIKKLKDEKEKVSKDIEKKPEKKSELEKYNKCIDKCIKKVEAYKSAKISDPDDDFDMGLDDNSSDSSSSSSDDDFDLDMDLDFKLESALVAIESMNTIMNAYQSNISDRLCTALKENSDISTGVCMDTIYAAAQCNRSINFSNIAEVARSIKKGRPIHESSSIEFTICDMGMKVHKDSLEDIIKEAYIVEQFEDILNEGFNVNKLKLLMQAVKGKFKDLSTKEKAFWKNMDVLTSGFMKNVEKAMTSDRREGIIKGSLIPSFSKCVKTAIAIGGISFINPILGIITAMGIIGTSKALNNRERQLIYDEIDTELKVVDKEIEMANNDGDMKKYRCLLQYQKRLEREKQRIKYGIKVHGRSVPIYDTNRKEY